MSHKVFRLLVILLLVLSLNLEFAGSAYATTMAQIATSNLIVNGDFEAGDREFSSGYTLGGINVTEGVYGILTDPFSVHPAADSFGDHTSGQGLMMAVNGVGSPGLVVWSQSVPVIANTDYEFSAWIASWYPDSPAQLQFQINGNAIETFTASSTTGRWQQFMATWNSGVSTSAMIEIINLNTAPHGNDFALDDLSLRRVTCDRPTPNSTPTNTSTSTPTGTFSSPTNMPTNTSTDTPPSTLGQLKLCMETRSSTDNGRVYEIKVDNGSYNLPVGYCVLAGQYPLKKLVTIQQTIPAGEYVFDVDVKPDRDVSIDRLNGGVVVEIGSGVTEVIYTNDLVSTLTLTPTPKPTRTPPACDPNCTPTQTPVPFGRMQICKEADGTGVSGSFIFRWSWKSRSVPVGACTPMIYANVGWLTITEDAHSGYTVSDIYTIPANRLISKDLNNRTVTVSIVSGDASAQTVIVFVNQAAASR